METAGKKLQLSGPLTETEASQKTRPLKDLGADSQISVAEKNDLYEISQRSNEGKSAQETNLYYVP